MSTYVILTIRVSGYKLMARLPLNSISGLGYVLVALPISNAPEAGVMNFIGAREAVSLFPKSTFLHRTFYPVSRRLLGSDWNPPWVAKYASRGYHIDTSSRDPASATGARSVADRHSWVINLDRGVAHSTRPHILN